MAVLDHDHAYLLKSDNRTEHGNALSGLQFALFWVGFFAFIYAANFLISLAVM